MVALARRMEEAFPWVNAIDGGSELVNNNKKMFEGVIMLYKTFIVIDVNVSGA